MLHKKQVEASADHKDMDPISKSTAFLWLKRMRRIFWFSQWAKIWFGPLSQKTACLSSRKDASSHRLGHCF